MERWLNRVAVVTGASSAIGAACCKDLAAKGLLVVGLARSKQQLNKLKSQLPPDQAQRFYYTPCDVSNEHKVKKIFAWRYRKLGCVDVLINNADILNQTRISTATNNIIMVTTIESILLGLTWGKEAAFDSLRRRSVNDGHVIIINNAVGCSVPMSSRSSMKVYGMGMSLMEEFVEEKFKYSKTKITSMIPGLINVDAVSIMRPEDVANAVSNCIQKPPTVQFVELIIKPPNL